MGMRTTWAGGVLMLMLLGAVLVYWGYLGPGGVGTLEIVLGALLIALGAVVFALAGRRYAASVREENAPVEEEEESYLK